MYIEKLSINSFGRLSNLNIDFSRGLNIIEGPNESGKSTLAAFIKFILYGAPSKERAALLSWDTGNASGSMTLVSDNGERKFRIERSVVGSKESVQLIDAHTNLQIKNLPASTPIGEILFGVDADMFSSTAFVSQVGSGATGGVYIGGAKVSEGIENILFSADESVNTKKAAAKLDSARVALLHKNEKGGLLYDIREECALLELRLSKASSTHKEISELEAQLSDLKLKLTEADTKAKSATEKAEGCEARALLRLFERAEEIRAKIRILSENLSRTDSEEIAKLGELERTVSSLNLLKEESERLSSADAVEQTPPISNPILDDYVANGGRQGLENEILVLRTHGKTFTLLGVLALIVGLGAVVFGLFPMLLHKSPAAIPLAIGAAAVAGAVTMLILSARKLKTAKAISEKYDFDRLDGELTKMKSKQDAAELAALAAQSAKSRYLEAHAAAEAKYGCHADKLGEKLTELTKKQEEYSKIKIECDTQRTLLSQIEEQVRPYNEEELRAKAAAFAPEDGGELQVLRREAEFFSKQAEALEKRTTELEKTLAGLYPTAEDPSALSDKLALLKAKASELEKKHAAYKLAHEMLTEAGESLRAGVAPKLAKDAAELMSEITEGKYGEMGVGTALDMTVTTKNGLKPLSVLSAGTKDAAYIALRLSLISLLYRDENPPVVYDEAFSRQDDRRLLGIMKLISLGSVQSIVFTSNGREAATAEVLGDFTHIKL